MTQSARPEQNIYCDESCHLENDDQKVMVIGAIHCPKNQTDEIFNRIREIKVKYNLKPKFDIKWNKVSESKYHFYKELIDFFFDDDDLGFRAILIPDKNLLDHKRFNHTHDDFYYKIYFDMLKVILNPDSRYNIYLDIKDTQGAKKVRKLHDVLSNNQLDFKKSIIKKIQQVRSHEVELIQLTDLLIGSISYHNRGLRSSKAKLNLIKRIQERSGYTLDKSTLLRENKLNILRWESGYE